MYVSISFHHSKYGLFIDNKYARELVTEYEKFWNEVTDLSKRNDVEIHLSNVELYKSNKIGLIIYIKEEKNRNSQEVIDSIEKIDTNLLFLKDIHYVVAKERAFNDFSPWIQSNIYLIVPSNRNINTTKDEQNYDFYISESGRNKRYYIYNK